MNTINRSPRAQFEAATQNRPCISVALADDHPIVRYALREALTLEKDMKVVGESASSAEILRESGHTSADILIGDFQVSDPSVSTALDGLRYSNRKPKLILFRAFKDKNELVQALKLGCSGIVSKRSATENIVTCVRKVHAGGVWVDCQAKAFVMQQDYTAVNQKAAVSGKALFSRREREILDFVVQGSTNSEIAARLFVSLQTVKNHLHHMYNKLGVTDRLELVLYAVHASIQRATECNRPSHRSVRQRKELCVTSLA